MTSHQAPHQDRSIAPFAASCIVGIPALTFALVFADIPPWSTLYAWLGPRRPSLFDAGVLALPTSLLALALVCLAAAVAHIARPHGARLRRRWRDRQHQRRR